MKKSILTILGLLAFGALAQARSLDPCTPTVEAQPIYISCVDEHKDYGITIKTLMSPASCQGEPIEVKRAVVEAKERATSDVQIYEIFEGFSYTLDLEFASFKSEVPALDLQRCLTPSHGGVSFGN